MSNLPEAWDGLVMALSNSCGTGTLKFDDVIGVLLNKEARKKSGAAKTSGSALSVDQRGTPTNRDEKKNSRPKSKLGKVFPSQRVQNVSGAVKMGIFRGTASRRKMEKEKAKRRIPHMSRRVMDLML